MRESPKVNLLILAKGWVMQGSASVLIDRPIADVFKWTTEDIAQWSTVVVEDEVIQQTDDHVGTTFRSLTQSGNEHLEFQGVVTRYDAPFVSAVHLTGKQFDIDTEFTFEDVDGKTRVTQHATVTGKGVLKLLFGTCGWLFGRSQCKANQNELNCLKQYCERQLDQNAGAGN